MKAHIVVLGIIDFDNLGADGIKDEILNARFANDCMSPNVLEIQSVDIGEWREDMPINQSKTAASEWKKLFNTGSIAFDSGADATTGRAGKQ